MSYIFVPLLPNSGPSAAQAPSSGQAVAGMAAAIAGAQINRQKVVINASWGPKPSTRTQRLDTNGPGSNAWAVDAWERFHKSILDVLAASDWAAGGNVILSKSAGNGAKFVDPTGAQLGPSSGIDITAALNRLASDPKYGPILRDNVIFFAALEADGSLAHYTNHGSGVIYGTEPTGLRGTSFIAPQGTGAILNAWNQFGELSSSQIKEALESAVRTNGQGFSVLDVERTVELAGDTFRGTPTSGDGSDSGGGSSGGGGSGGGSDPGGGTGPAPGPVATVQLFSNPDLTGFLAPGTTVQFSAVARDAAGNVVGCTPTFAVSNPVGDNVGTINANTGLLVVGQDDGAASVTATCGGVRSDGLLLSGSGSGQPEPSATTYDGLYNGNYMGSATITGVTLPANGAVQFRVLNGAITVLQPGGGSGIVGALGTTNFSSGVVALPGSSCTFTGQFTLGTAGSASANGGWSCTIPGGSASGTWNAAR